MEETLFPQGRELIEIIESHGWTLFDATGRPSKHRERFSISDLEKRGKAREIAIDHNYAFWPVPNEGESYRAAICRTNCLGPALRVENPDEERWASLEVHGWYTNPLKVGIFTRIEFNSAYAFCFSPEDSILRDFIAMHHEYVIDTFKRYFTIVTPEQVGLTISPVNPIEFN